MQLDRTRIAIRERGLLETIDLALHVTREFAAPLAVCALAAIVPLALINYALVGWMTPSDFDEETFPLRYLWNMTALIYLEAPLAASLMVAYLGPAVFHEERTIRQVLGDVVRCAGPLALCQGLLRGTFVAWAVLLLTTREEANGFTEGFLLFVILAWSTAMRAFRPYVNEIILLEKNPLWSRGAAITVGKRSAHLHGPYSGDLFIRWCGSAGAGLVLSVLTLGTAFFVLSFLISDPPFYSSTDPPAFAWNLGGFKLQVLYPACLWFVAAFLAVVRFLNYLDLRIRHEGWEVELLTRAEALRLATQLE
jgi:hypothetical protein